jgi:hypothetical protein
MPLIHYFFNFAIFLNQVHFCVAQCMVGVWELGIIMQQRYLGLVLLYLQAIFNVDSIPRPI